MYPIGYEWQLSLVHQLAPSDHNWHLAFWIRVVRRLMSWRPPTRRGGRRRVTTSTAWFSAVRSWIRLASSLLRHELSFRLLADADIEVQACDLVSETL